MILNAITLFDTIRLRSLIKQCNEQNIELHLWNGITDFDVKKNISMSHKQIVKYAKENNIEKICICEDDCLLINEKSFKYFIDNIPDDNFDMYFGGLSGGMVDEQNIVHNFSGLFMYCISERFYDVFLSADETKNLDRWLGNVYYRQAEVKPVYKVCNPLVAKTIDGYSAHHACDFSYDNYWKLYKYLI